MTQTTPTPLWRPRAQDAAETMIGRYGAWLAQERGLRFPDYDALWRWSVDELEDFWRSIWDHYGVRSDVAPTTVLVDRAMPGADWFPGTRLNYAEHVFADRDPAAIAVVHASELRERAELTWGELRALAGRVRAGLVAAGVGPGDRVVAYLPNIPEAVAALMATASLGAIWSCVAPEMGAASAIDRFAQIGPTVLIAVDGYRYGGRDFDRTATVVELEAALPTLRRTVLLPYLDPAADPAVLRHGVAWSAFTADAAPLAFARVAFADPLWILYSSGTTGPPKAIVHSQGGILLEHLKKLHLHVDARPGDRLFWFTTTGWMMWNFLVGGLLTDAAIVLYDGSPAFPTLDRLWDLAADVGITCLGASAGFIAASMAAGVRPAAGRDLSRLRAVGSTGSPLSPEGFEWVYAHLPDVWLFSSSGGTDVCTSFLGGVPTLPVYAGELQARALGAAAVALDEDGVPHLGVVGELVLTEPMPSMPVGFWGDADGSRYHDAYFATFPGRWRHGDWVEISDRGTAVIHGRSDATINRGGIRMGTAEIYRSVLRMDELADALVVDVPRPDGSSWMPLFVVLAPGAVLDDGLRARIARRLREDCSPRHVPDRCLAVAEIPRTLSGKVPEVPVKRILMGVPAEQAIALGALANPDALAPFVALARETAPLPDPAPTR